MFVVGTTLGALTGITSAFLPMLGSCLGCVAALGVGVLGVWYHHNQTGTGVGAGDGAVIGAGAAAVMVIAQAILNAVFALINMAPSISEQQQQALDQLGELPPEQQDAFRALVESDFFVPFVIGCTLVFYVTLGAIGGAIGGGLFADDADAARSSRGALDSGETGPDPLDPGDGGADAPESDAPGTDAGGTPPGPGAAA